MSPTTDHTKNKQKKTGAWLCVYALEQLPVSHTFGIPGLQNTEIYDELNSSKTITPILVTHEGGASFMADGISRTSDKIGVLVIVPSAGVPHAMSGIAEAFLDGIPMLVISGGIRRDTGNSYQLHQWDQHQFLKSATKKTWLITHHSEIVPTLFDAYHTAVSGEPGPVFVEIPVDIQNFKGTIESLPVFHKKTVDEDAVRNAADMLKDSKRPCIFAGWGCRDAGKDLTDLAERLHAPVSTTLQGLSVFPASHPLHTGMGFGKSSVPAAENAFKGCDCLLAVGTRFGEIPTGSFGVSVPENLIHIDINPDVFNKNYPAKITITGDACTVLSKLNHQLNLPVENSASPRDDLEKNIRDDKAAYLKEWEKLKTDKVNPASFFTHLRAKLSDDAIVVADDGNHTFLTAELFPVYQPKHFILPTDFNCMGYCIPAAIGAKFANPEKQVAGIVGDGAFLMTCMEILTASANNLGIMYFVFHDGELSQISQGQEIPYNRKTCSVLSTINIRGVAEATGAAYLLLSSNQDIGNSLTKALSVSSEGRPVIIDVRIDYSKRTRFTKGVVGTVLKRFPLKDRIRFVGRAVKRKITG